jgi:hypothetical protein
LLQDGFELFDCIRILVGCKMITHFADKDSILQADLLLFLGVRLDKLIKGNVVEG